MNQIFINKPGKSTIVLVIVPTGAFTEIDAYKGISHFVEHLCFKGNHKRNQKQISSAIDNIGGDLNAFTDWEITAYWAKVGNSYRDLAIEVITDLATKPLFPIKEIDKEREVIIQELKMYEDDPKDYCEEVFNKALYAKQSGFYLNIVGTKETLYDINRDVLIGYHKEKYNNPTLIVVGDIKNKGRVDKPYEIKYIPSELAVYKDKTLVERENITQANILIGNSVNLSKVNKEDIYFAFNLLNAVYGDMSGRLFEVIREKHNLVYRVHFEHQYFSNGTIQWAVSAGLDKDKIDMARELSIKELMKPVSKKDLEMALIKSIGVKEMSLDSVTQLGYSTAYSLIRGIDYNEILFNYEKGLKRAIGIVNELIRQMKFDNNILVGIVPKGVK
jgi:predicted Zn-dependent peptidase